MGDRERRAADLHHCPRARSPAKSTHSGPAEAGGDIEHIGYTVADFDRERAKADLIAMGVKNVRDGGLYSLHMDDDAAMMCRSAASPTTPSPTAEAPQIAHTAQNAVLQAACSRAA